MPMIKPLLAALALALLACPSFAQDNKAASREREALRRAQMALKAAQEGQSALQNEKAALSKEKEQLAQDAQRARGQHAALQGQAQKARAEADKLQQEVEALKRSLAEAKASGEAQAQQVLSLQQKGQTLQALVDERTRVNQALSGLLERSTLALADAEGKNKQMHAVGLKLIDHLRKRTPFENAAAADPLFGLSAVRLENQAESLRSELEVHRIVR